MIKKVITGILIFVLIILLLTGASFFGMYIMELAKLPALTQQDPLKLKSELNKKEIKIGEPFEYKVTLYEKANLNAKMDVLKKDNFKDFVLYNYKSSSRVIPLQNVKVTEATYYLQPKEMKVSYIPEIKAIAGSFAKVLPPVKITPLGVLPKQNNMKDVHPLKPIEKYFIFKIWYILIPLAIVLVVFLLLYGLSKIKFNPKKEKQPKVLLPPYQVAFSQLAELKKMNLETEEDFRIFYTRLSEILRNYLDGTFKIGAIEKTSEEINSELYDISLNLAMRTLVKSVLRDSDMVKFAKYFPTKEKAFASLEKTSQFIDGTRVESEPANNYREKTHV